LYKVKHMKYNQIQAIQKKIRKYLK